MFRERTSSTQGTFGFLWQLATITSHGGYHFHYIKTPFIYCIINQVISPNTGKARLIAALKTVPAPERGNLRVLARAPSYNAAFPEDSIMSNCARPPESPGHRPCLGQRPCQVNIMPRARRPLNKQKVPSKRRFLPKRKETIQKGRLHFPVILKSSHLNLP